jgi:hypothetical protein
MAAAYSIVTNSVSPNYNGRSHAVAKRGKEELDNVTNKGNPDKKQKGDFAESPFYLIRFRREAEIGMMSQVTHTLP